MAIMYARSSLNTWSNLNTGGWSNSSGGASNGQVPDSTTDVIFDANSGTSRTIATSDDLAIGWIPFKTIDTSAANAMTFGASAALKAHGNANFSGSNSTADMLFGATSTINSGNSVFNSFNNNGFAITLSSNMTTTSTGVLTLSGSVNFNANNFNVTVGSFSSSGSGSITMGSGTWSMTDGVGTLWGIGPSTTVTPGTSTVKFTGGTAGTKTFAGQGKTYNNFWNATTAGAANITGTNTFNDFKVSAGSTQQMGTGITTTVTTFSADGTGGQIALNSGGSGSVTTITKAGGGSIYVDRCTIRDIAATPSSTWNARNSTNVSNNSGITFIPGNSAFFQFF